MKETGIIMSGDHPRLILDGLKTMTRRAYGLEFVNQDPDLWIQPYQLSCEPALWTFRNRITGEVKTIKCPYGQVGDRLRVRETWRIESFMDGEPLLFGYKDGQTMEENEYSDTPEYEDWYERVCIQSTEDAEKAFKRGTIRQDENDYYRWDIGWSPCRWRSPRFMPRWAARIWLEITGLRAERLQDITAGDVLREGINSEGMSWDWIQDRGQREERNFSGLPTLDYAEEWYIKQFAKLWDSLNKKYPWGSNLWVWPISFKGIA